MEGRSRHEPRQGHALALDENCAAARASRSVTMGSTGAPSVSVSQYDVLAVWNPAPSFWTRLTDTAQMVVLDAQRMKERMSETPPASELCPSVSSQTERGRGRRAFVASPGTSGRTQYAAVMQGRRRWRAGRTGARVNETCLPTYLKGFCSPANLFSTPSCEQSMLSARNRYFWQCKRAGGGTHHDVRRPRVHF